MSCTASACDHKFNFLFSTTEEVAEGFVSQLEDLGHSGIPPTPRQINKLNKMGKSPCS